MKLEVSLAIRLQFLARATERQRQHLLDTDKRLFGNLFTVERTWRSLPALCAADISLCRNG